MQCDQATRMLHAGETTPDLDIHLSACDPCRAVSDDLAQLAGAFARARASWTPSDTFRVRLPVAPWRKLAVAASLLLIPLAAWAYVSVDTSDPSHDISLILETRAATPPSDRETLGMLFLGEGQ